MDEVRRSSVYYFRVANLCVHVRCQRNLVPLYVKNQVIVIQKAYAEDYKLFIPDIEDISVPCYALPKSVEWQFVDHVVNLNLHWIEIILSRDALQKLQYLVITTFIALSFRGQFGTHHTIEIVPVLRWH